MCLINYECCNGQWTHASHAIMMQQRHNALDSHGFSTQWGPSAGHTALHSPVNILTHNFGTQFCQSAWHTALHGTVSTLKHNFGTQLCQYVGHTALHGSVSTITHKFGTQRCQSAGHTALHGPVSNVTHNFGTQRCQSAGHTMICAECDAHKSYNPEIYFHVYIRLFYLFTIKLYISQINGEPLLHFHQFPNILESAERRTAISAVYSRQ
jgi:hypothetical protein